MTNNQQHMQNLFTFLCTEEMINNGNAKKVYYFNKSGYLMAFDAGLGFTFWSEEDNGFHYELSADEISTTPTNGLKEGNPVLVTYGWNDVLKKPYQFLYEFGYYNDQGGCIVYSKGNRNMQDSHAFELNQVRGATEEDLTNYYWGN